MVALIRWNPDGGMALRPFGSPFSLLEEVEEMARSAFETSLVPKLDMYEEDKELVIKAELPGIQKEDINISLEGDTLRIEAEKKQEETTEETRYYSYERYYGHYSRSVPLPTPVEAEKVSATFENGLLEIKLPRAEETKPRHIEVKVESPKPKRTRTSQPKSK